MTRTIQRLAIRTLRGPARNFQAPRASHLRHASEATYWLTRAFYVFAIFVAFDMLRRLDGIGRSGNEILPLWPVLWVPEIGLALSAKIIGFGLIATAMASVAFPSLRLPRIAFFVALLMAVAMRNSFGSISHSEYYPLWLSLFMIFGPTRKLAPGASPSAHYLYTLPFFVAQVFIGLFYTLSGIFKVEGGFFVKAGNVSSFSPEALPILIMGRWLESGTPPMLESFFSENIWLAWPTYLAVIYIELVFLIAVFRPQLHRLFGVTTATFHIGVFLTMGIIFSYQSALVCLLFACSPFAPERHSIRQMALQMPILGRLPRLIARLGARSRPAPVRVPVSPTARQAAASQSSLVTSSQAARFTR